MRFADTNGREWVIQVDAFTLQEAIEEFQIDLSSPGKLNQSLQDLSFNEVLLVQALWVTCRASAPDGYTLREFAKGIVGDKLTTAREALERALLDFFPKWKRDLLKAWLLEAETARQQAKEVSEGSLNLAGATPELSESSPEA